MTALDPQPPAAPETDVRLTEAERDYFCGNLRQNLGYRAHVIEDTMLRHVERIVAERVREVEGERDAEGPCGACGEPLTTDSGYTGWVAYHRECARTVYGDTFTERARHTRATLLDAQCDADDLRSRLHLATARAESAEAAHEALRAGVEALADEYAANGAQREAAGRPAWPSNVARDLRALLAGDAR